MSTAEEIAASRKRAVNEASRRFASARRNPELKFAQERAFLDQQVARPDKAGASLRGCTEQSLLNAVVQSASLGLSLNPILRHVYLIARRVTPKGVYPEIHEAYASPSYQGLIHLLVQSGAIRQIAAEIVYRADYFKLGTPFELPVHSATLDNSQRTEAHAIGVYVVTRLGSGDVQTGYMDRTAVQYIRSKSEQPDSMMWNPDALWTEGWKKAALRREWKMLPKVQALFHVEQYLNENEGIDFDRRNDVTVIEQDDVPRITHEQAESLTAMIREAGMDVPRWTARLTARLSMPGEALENVPAARYSEAREIITAGLKSAQANAQRVLAADPPPTEEAP